MEIMTKNEGLELFQELDRAASENLEKSKENLLKAMIALDVIREKRLYTYGEFSTWEEYIKHFRDCNGVSRSLTFENLKAIRIASRCGFDHEEISEIGLYTLKPWFDSKSPVVDYDRYSGEVLGLEATVEAKLPPGDDLSSRYGALVRQKLVANEPPALVREMVSDVAERERITFSRYFEDGEWMGLEWYSSMGPSGFILFEEPPELPKAVTEKMLNLLKIQEGE